MPVKITGAGDPCRHCLTPVVRRSHAKPPKPTKAYYFEWWFACPKCKALYMVEDAKRFFNAPAVTVERHKEPEQRFVIEEADFDGAPPWGMCGPECPACRR